MTILLTLVLLFLLMLGWLLLSPLIIEADTRLPEIRMEWKRLVTLRITYAEGVGWISVKTYFYQHTWRLGAHPAKAGSDKQVAADGKKKPGARKKPRTRRRRKTKQLLLKGLRVLRTFRIVRMEIALDTSDPVMNAQLYPLNFYPYPPGRSVRINFLEENYLLLRLSNTPWRMLKAWTARGI
ncbi:hypothetical protein Q4E93_19915 [Flavitalea sp. BT771]|uniref:hypothetical protein n=1 Tax=Flavitalea sp. BT771 TaxID=3063329 RepID=UPI0026E1EDB9|nr:hypothetical protein [Flavitalea sp. BT771]MDO6432885.1 hypothetical protein [Flavitalea sp. BT771]MDV6221839.1 hypothetical protein [Flavitalea sp. BT771]